MGFLIYGDAEAAVRKEILAFRSFIEWNLIWISQDSPVSIEVDCGIREYGHNKANCRTLVAVNTQQTRLLHACGYILVAIAAYSYTILSFCITFKILSAGAIPRQSLRRLLLTCLLLLMCPVAIN